MSHLVKPIPVCDVSDACERITKVIQYFHRCLKENVNDLASVLNKPSWSTDLKRIKVILQDDPPCDIGPEVGSKHNFIEVINQVATMQRLKDTLVWAKDGVKEYRWVKKCHPTTSSDKNSPTDEDNDLILSRSKDWSGGEDKVHFEVSDVVGGKDGNGKLIKDLLSLKAIKKMNGDNKYEKGDWLEDTRKQLYLTVSSEFGKYISGVKKLKAQKDVPFEFEVVSGPPNEGSTWIIKVKIKK